MLRKKAELPRKFGKPRSKNPFLCELISFFFLLLCYAHTLTVILEILFFCPGTVSQCYIQISHELSHA